MKYPKIQHLDDCLDILDNPVYVFEKLDGANCRISSTNGQLQLASRSGQAPKNPSRAVWWDDFQSWAYTFYGGWQGRLGVTLDELLPENYVFFGEWLSEHTIHYQREARDQFYLIDVYDVGSERFLPYEWAGRVATIDGLLDLNTVPVLAHGILERTDIQDLLEGSDYAVGKKEGLVIKDYVNQRFAKFPNPEFSEMQDSAKGLSRYLTMRRVHKVAEKLRDQGISYDHKLLKNEFIRDLYAEAQKHFDYDEAETWFDHAMRFDPPENH